VFAIASGVLLAILIAVPAGLRVRARRRQGRRPGRHRIAAAPPRPGARRTSRQPPGQAARPGEARTSLAQLRRLTSHDGRPDAPQGRSHVPFSSRRPAVRPTAGSPGVFAAAAACSRCDQLNDLGGPQLPRSGSRQAPPQGSGPEYPRCTLDAAGRMGVLAAVAAMTRQGRRVIGFARRTLGKVAMAGLSALEAARDLNALLEFALHPPSDRSRGSRGRRQPRQPQGSSPTGDPGWNLAAASTGHTGDPASTPARVAAMGEQPVTARH
jgi:hypothetical protein